MGVITCIHLGLKPKMPKQPSSHAAPRSDLFFVKELAGETPPTLAAMRDLYDHVTHLFSLTPWQLIGESELILTRDSQTGEQWWCSVMGSAGEVYSMHAYRGEEGLRSLRKIENEEIRDPGEVMASMDCLYVEFVPGSELSRRDRELLNALDHPRGKKMVAPVFRSIRPGFHPWYVNAEEARTLAECVRAVSFICSVVAADASCRCRVWDRLCTGSNRIHNASSGRLGKGFRCRGAKHRPVTPRDPCAQQGIQGILGPSDGFAWRQGSLQRPATRGRAGVLASLGVHEAEAVAAEDRQAEASR